MLGRGKRNKFFLVTENHEFFEMSDNEDVNDDLFVHDDSYDPDKAGFH